MQLVENQRTRLYVEGVQSAITAAATRRRSDGMVVTQALPFLRLDTSVTESGRRARIARVAIAMDGDMPKLLLELLHEPEIVPEEEDTVETFTPGVSTAPARTDGTVPYEFQAKKERAAEIVLSDAPIVRHAAPLSVPWYVRIVRLLVAAFASLTSTPV